ARALHATVAVGQEITREHYKAVAAAIRFADRMHAKRREQG
ncbi:MAG: EscU/YscU/HrcU family type III secretion system export apparatus switch protein, partial [Mangrovicoccus sp.]|nr:EscU/YscU/HrcU family type III secretion system export apparatus switch protein [Mangrovicoccus sp.]